MAGGSGASETDHGGCPKNRIVETPDGELGLDYRCAGYPRVFSRVQPSLEVFRGVVERGHPLSAAMDVIAERDRRRED